ncbi:MAG: hypothetical protein KatS3mg083_243 [Candidatus Dojkabacteria bacterium]|nr:MAG: hypothetical protein KatS3mg083_243 [Candidatus Dojkabacteria bacterium]
MHKDGKQYFNSYIKQKFCCPFRTKKDDSLCPCNHKKYFNFTLPVCPFLGLNGLFGLRTSTSYPYTTNNSLI